MKTKQKMNKMIIYVLASIVLIVFVGPYLWMLATALKTPGEVMAWPPTILPEKLYFENFVTIWQNSVLPRAFLNSVIVALTATVINVFFASLAAFAFARLDFPGKNGLFLTVLATMMIPSGLMVVPLFSMIRHMPFAGANGWLDSYAGLIIPTAVTGFAIFLLRQYFMSIPKDLDDQATIDGCSRLKVYWKIIMPLSRPALGLVAIFSFLGNWNEYLWHLTVARSEEMYTLQIALARFQTEHNIEWTLIMAGATTAAIPMLIIYFLLQPLFERGLSGIGTGMKD
ncbi:carbohydrate ABC transporter permease [Gracilibacillus alcaliphilus]|uniref:carbohydrate ABC transporter permease n=1 Tax=Gracilibacillus alcaliphilus TaxID=1401441 RepID=UPI00195E176A|nr:carbohydrate ABC transporter permease [Gracilibacillus alcaliphilus]MBM7676749.1 multiple sugar transport system permease protein [Gracilibacillus alcaliphilus]